MPSEAGVRIAIAEDELRFLIQTVVARRETPGPGGNAHDDCCNANEPDVMPINACQSIHRPSPQDAFRPSMTAIRRKIVALYVNAVEREGM